MYLNLKNIYKNEILKNKFNIIIYLIKNKYQKITIIKK